MKQNRNSQYGRMCDGRQQAPAGLLCGEFSTRPCQGAKYTMRFFQVMRLPTLFCGVLLLCCRARGQPPDSLLVVPGDVVFAAMFDVNDLENGGCGDYDVNILQHLVAVTWFVEEINKMNYVPGVTVGLEAYRTCKKPEMATEGAVKLFNKYSVLSRNNQSNNVLFGMIGPDRTSDALAVSRFISSLPANQRLVQISGSATGKQLSDKTLYPNFFRVIPPDDTQVEVMLELLVQLKWNYVAIVYDDDDYGRSAATELRRLAEGRELCVPVFESVPLDVSSATFQTRAASIEEQLKSPENGLVRGLVMFGGFRTTQQLHRTLSKRVAYVRLVLSEAVGLDRAAMLTLRGQVSSLTAGALATSAPYLHAPELRSLWNDVWSNRTAFENQAGKIPWLAEYFTQLAGTCSLSEPDCWQNAEQKRTTQMIPEGREVNLYTGYQVKAAAVMAALLKRLHGDICGPSSSGLCARLKETIFDRGLILSKLRQSSFDLREFSSVSEAFANTSSVRFNETNGNAVNVGPGADYDVFNFRRDGQGEFNFEMIGSWMNETLRINTTQAEFYDDSKSPLTWSQLPPAQCGVNQDCLKCEYDVSNDVIFIEGDFYVVTIVPVSDKKTDDLLTCGDIKGLAGADIAQSVVFAVEEANKKAGMFSGMLTGRTVGLVVINNCGSQLLVRKRLMELHEGTLALPGGRNSSSILASIMGYVGAYFSSSSMAVSETLNAFTQPFVQISGASTSPDLSDMQKYPNFLRIATPDDKQAQAVLDIVKRLGASYIQVIYDSSTAYATALFTKLQEESAKEKYGVCIAQSIATTPSPDFSRYNKIHEALRKKSAARVVVVVLHPEEIKKVLDAILPELDENEFLFLGSESWGERKQLLEGASRTKLHGSLVLSQRIRDESFQRYFQHVRPTESVNPWLKYFWEARLNCYFNMSFRRRGKSGPCPDDAAQTYEQDPRVPFHTNAVYALVLGFNSSLAEHCGVRATRICAALTSEKLFSAMLEVKLSIVTDQATRVFESNGDGRLGYQVMQISRDLTTSAEDVIYKDVGSWSLGNLSLDMKRLTLPGGSGGFTSACPNVKECNACFPLEQSNSSSLSNECSSGEISVAVFVSVVVILIVIIGVLVAAFVFLVRRLKLEMARKRSPETYVDNITFTSVEPASSSDSPYHYIEDRLRVQMPLPPPPPPCTTTLQADYLHPVPDTDGDNPPYLSPKPDFMNT